MTGRGGRPAVYQRIFMTVSKRPARAGGRLLIAATVILVAAGVWSAASLVALLMDMIRMSQYQELVRMDRDRLTEMLSAADSIPGDGGRVRFVYGSAVIGCDGAAGARSCSVIGPES